MEAQDSMPARIAEDKIVQLRELALNFRNCFTAELRACVKQEPVLSKFISELEAIDCSSTREFGSEPLPVAVTKYLETAIDQINCSHPLAVSIGQLAASIKWYQIFQGEGIEPTLSEGLVAGQVAGQVGIFDASSIRTGLFLLAPGIHYPLHQHGAHEIYFVVSGQLVLQHLRTGTPFAVKPGQFSVTPPHHVHALTVNQNPCLLIYAWIGEVEAPNWWWEQDDAGSWSRICWIRRPDARWVRTTSEPISEEILKEAGEK